MSNASGRNPVVTAVLVVILGLIVAVGLGMLLMWVGSNRMEVAKRTERPYHLAFGYMAQDASGLANQAEAAINGSNWGEARTFLDLTGKVVLAMTQAASDADRDRVRDVQTSFEEARTAVGKQDKDAARKVAALRARLEQFVVK